MSFFRLIFYWLVTILIYLGIVLLGWGLLDMAGYFSLPQRLSYALMVGLFSLAVGVQAYGSTEGIRGGKGEQDKFVFRERLISIGMVIFLYLALFFIPYFDRRGLFVLSEGNLIRWVGVPFTLAGYGLIFWSGLALGRQYSADVTIQAGHQLVTDSIYRFIRHPRYLGVMALSIGVACIFRSWIGLLASVALLGVLIFRIRDEEAVMHEQFGMEWETYCQGSWRLVPFLY